jgi:putative membrane protein
MKSGLKAVLALAAGMLTISAQAQTPPTDPQIVGIVVAANQIDIDHGKLALSRTRNSQVHDFAQQMITDHTAVQKSVFDLGAKLHVTPADSDTSASLKKQATETTEKLKSLKGAAFDKVYLDSEVGYHAAVIDALKNVLIPNAQNAELKTALTGAVPLFEGHLEHAKNLQAELDGKSASATNPK